MKYIIQAISSMCEQYAQDKLETRTLKMCSVFNNLCGFRKNLEFLQFNETCYSYSKTINCVGTLTQ